MLLRRLSFKKRHSQTWLGRSTSREIYLGSQPPKKGNFVLGILFLLVILVFSFWGLYRAGREKSLSEYESTLVGAQQNLDESVKIVGLNPARAKELAFSVKSAAQELTERGVKDKRLKKLQESLTENLPRLLGEYKIEPQVLVDLGLAKEGFSTSATSVALERILALDREKHIVLSFNFSGGSMQVVAGKDTIPEAKLVATDNRAVFVLDGQRIARIPFEKEPTARSLVLPEGSWGRIVTLGTYGGSLYLVDAVKNQIWKYSASTERAGEGEAWLTHSTRSTHSGQASSGQELSLASVISMSIDGSIWLLTREGEILRFVQGSKTQFRIKGLEQEFANPTSLFTNGDSENIYILDSGNSRIVVFDKEGNYKAQYLWDELAQASSIAVSEEKKKILIFLGGKVYETPLEM